MTPPPTHRCRECVYRQKGYTTFSARTKDYICTLRPKFTDSPRAATKPTYYRSPPYAPACRHFQAITHTPHEPSINLDAPDW